MGWDDYFSCWLLLLFIIVWLKAKKIYESDNKGNVLLHSTTTTTTTTLYTLLLFLPPSFLRCPILPSNLLPYKSLPLPPSPLPFPSSWVHVSRIRKHSCLWHMHMGGRCPLIYYRPALDPIPCLSHQSQASLMSNHFNHRFSIASRSSLGCLC